MGPAVFLVVLFPLKNKNKTADLIGASLLSDSLAMRSAVLCFLFVKAFEVLFCLRLSIVFGNCIDCKQMLTDAHKDTVLRTLVVACSVKRGPHITEQADLFKLNEFNINFRQQTNCSQVNTDRLTLSLPSKPLLETNLQARGCVLTVALI